MGKFVVIGLGNFGFNVAIALTELGHQVLVIDSDSKKIEHIEKKVWQSVVGDGRDKGVLSKFISADIDAVIICLGTEVEASTLATLHLKKLGSKKIIVKAMNDDHAQILKLIGATEIVFPEKEVATRVAQRISIPNLVEHIPLTPEYGIVEITAPDKFVGKSLKELRLRSKYGVHVIAVKNILFNSCHLIPGADFKIEPDSILIIIGKESDIKKVERLKY